MKTFIGSKIANLEGRTGRHLPIEIQTMSQIATCSGEGVFIWHGRVSWKWRTSSLPLIGLLLGLQGKCWPSFLSDSGLHDHLEFTKACVGNISGASCCKLLYLWLCLLEQDLSFGSKQHGGSITYFLGESIGCSQQPGMDKKNPSECFADSFLAKQSGYQGGS